MSTNLEPETEQSSTPVNPKLNQEPQTFNTIFVISGSSKVKFGF